MRKLTCLAATLVICFFSCSKNENIESDCVDTKIEELNMIKFSGQEIGCKFFLELYHYNNKQFFLLQSHCADMLSYPIDCEGNKLCLNNGGSSCLKFYNNADRIGIVGLSE